MKLTIRLTGSAKFPQPEVQIMYSSLRLNVVGLLSLMTILWLSVGVQSAEGQGIITGTAEDARSG